MNMNKIDFKVKLTGSKLFDFWAYNTAKKLCAKFPGLDFKYNENEIHISGELNDYLYDKWNMMVFESNQIED